MNHDEQPIKNIQKAVIFRLDGRLVYLIYETGEPPTATAVTDTRIITGSANPVNPRSEETDDG